MFQNLELILSVIFFKLCLENNILSWYPLKQSGFSGIDADHKKDMNRSPCFTVCDQRGKKKKERKKVVLK